ncbi:MAG: glycoside hydrolase family 97 N-terminal domain-containing protein [bacterium]|nr:glycoside hydrolase family 97 N-terminal domain-containing protein [bacterium]
MHSRPLIRAAVFSLALIAGCGREPLQVWPLQSPAGRITVFVEQSAGSRALSFRVIESRDGAEIVRRSRLGIPAESGDSLQFISQTPVAGIDTAVVLAGGGTFGLRAFQTALTFENPAGARVQLDWLAADDGIAFRCRPAGAGSAVPPVSAWRVMTPADAAPDPFSGAGFAEAVGTL